MDVSDCFATFQSMSEHGFDGFESRHSRHSLVSLARFSPNVHRSTQLAVFKGCRRRDTPQMVQAKTEARIFSNDSACQRLLIGCCVKRRRFGPASLSAVSNLSQHGTQKITAQMIVFGSADGDRNCRNPVRCGAPVDL